MLEGLSAQSRTVFRIVTALAPPFVMQSEMDEDGLCLRGLPCHRLLPVGEHNLTLMFNAIETHYRLKEDAAEHGAQPPNDDERSNYDHSLYRYAYISFKTYLYLKYSITNPERNAATVYQWISWTRLPTIWNLNFICILLRTNCLVRNTVPSIIL